VKRLAPLLAVVALAGCGGHTAESVPPTAIAVVGDRVVTRVAFARELARTRRAYDAGGRTFPARGTPAFEQLRDSVVRLLVDRARLEVEARRAGVAIRPAQIEARLRRLKDTTFGGDQARYREQLRRAGMTDADVRQAIRTQLLAAALRGRERDEPKVHYASGFEPSGEP
jgi:hypothetical protein